ARTGRVGPVKCLIRRGVDVNARERHGQTALQWAAAEGHVEVIDLLIEAGADIHHTLDSGFDALFFAIREGRTGAVLRLLDAGARVNEPSRRRTKDRPGDARTTPLLLAVENGHFELAVELLERGADPNDQRAGQTALHALSQVRKPGVGDGEDGNPAPRGSGRITSLELVEALVEHGANVNARLERGSTSRGRLSRKGATPLFLAAI